MQNRTHGRQVSNRGNEGDAAALAAEMRKKRTKHRFALQRGIQKDIVAVIIPASANAAASGGFCKF